MKAAKLGFIALTDAAPLFLAKEKGIFAKYGMLDVEVQKQASWARRRQPRARLGGQPASSITAPSGERKLKW